MAKTFIGAFKKTPRQQLRSFGRRDELNAHMSSSFRRGNRELKFAEDVIKSKATQGLGFRTPDFFKASKFSKGGPKQVKFNPSQFRTQHKGGA